MQQRLREYTVPLILIICTLLAYSQIFGFGHISWDDPEMVFRNKSVQNFDLKAFFSRQFVGNYLPLTMLAHSIAWNLFGDWEGGHHGLNLALHILNGLLVLQVTRKLFSNEAAAMLSSAIFLLHPLQVESVVWISELKNVLSTSLYLLSLSYYISWLKNEEQKKLLQSLLLFLLGCLCRPSVVVLPVIFLALLFVFEKRPATKKILLLLPFFALSVLFGIINLYSQAEAQFINHAHEFPIWQRFGFAGYALVKYLVLFIWPSRLSVIYPYPAGSIAVFVTGFIAWALIVFFGAWFISRKKPHALFCLFFVIINLALVLQFIPFGEALYADRYMYVPVIGFAWMISHGAAAFKAPRIALVAVLAAALGAGSFFRVHVWKSAINLYEDILTKYPDLFLALNSAGVESMFLNRDEAALAYLNKAVQVAPRNYKGFYNRGLLLIKNNRPKEAIVSLNEALALYDYGKAYVARATAYYMTGDLSKALNDAELALKADEKNARAHYIKGNCFNDMNRMDQAISAYNKALALDGSESDFYFKRAVALGKKQDFKACYEDLVTAISMRPDNWEAYYWRAVAARNLGMDACKDLQVAARNNFEPAVNAFNKYCR